jgi:Uma2 family endonuclease
MSTIHADPGTPVAPVPPLAVRPVPPVENRLLLRHIAWPAYRVIADAFTGVKVRITYDRGTLEIMTKSGTHETWKSFIGRLIFALAEEVDQAIRGCGEMTCRRDDLQRAVEPGDCFYLPNEPRMRGKLEIVLGVDPPPDLMLEIEISRSAVARLPIFAALGVPEIWCFDGETVRFLNLSANGDYVAVERSRYFPFLAPVDILNVLQRWGQTDDNSLVRSFRQWIRQQRSGAGQ